MDEYQREEREAWDRYLADTRAPTTTDRYEEVEPWAWHRLTQALRASRYRLKGRLRQSAEVTIPNPAA